MMKRSQGPRCMTEVNHLKRATQKLRQAKTTTSAAKDTASVFNNLLASCLSIYGRTTNDQRSLFEDS